MVPVLRLSCRPHFAPLGRGNVYHGMLGWTGLWFACVARVYPLPTFPHALEQHHARVPSLQRAPLLQ